MPNNPAIDTTVLITILGLIAAVWAVVPANTRLRFRLGMSWIDWCVAIGVFLVVHYLIFEQSFRSVGLYYSFGPWKWGLDKGNSVYLLLLGLGLYILLRARKPKLANRKIGTLDALANTLLLTKRYDELFTLIEPLLFKLFKLTKHRPLLLGLVNKISLKPLVPEFRWEGENFITLPAQEVGIQRKYRLMLASLNSRLTTQDFLADRARDILKSLLNQPQFVFYMSVSHPHFCLRVLAIPEVIREDFTDLFVTALIADSNSLLYSELKNSENLNGCHRPALPRSNRIIYFWFNDVTTAQRLALYRPIGDAICRYINEDEKIVEAYNLPLGSYQQSGKYRCPVFAGIKLFEIMIHEAMHQGVQDHLWLHYFAYFTDGILKKLRDQQPEDSNYEFPTTFHYLIFNIVVITTNWISDCVEVDQSLIADQVKKSPGFDSHYIPKEAAKALGAITQKIFLSPKNDDRFKEYILETCLGAFKRIAAQKDAILLTQDFKNAIISGNGYFEVGYKQELYRVYKGIDHALRCDVDDFGRALEESQNQ